MENHNGASGRKRGLTKHSVEDQALDQIAKEKLVNLGRSSENAEKEHQDDVEEENDASPHVPDNVSEDSSTKEENNSTSQDISEMSEVPKPDSPVTFDDFWAEVDAADFPERNKSEMQSQETKGKKKHRKKKVKKEDLSEESDSSSSKSPDDNLTKEEVAVESNSSSRKSPVEVVTKEEVAVERIARKFDSEDEDWLPANEEEQDSNVLQSTRKFDSEDEDWLQRDTQNDEDEKEMTKNTRKFDSEDEQWLDGDEDEKNIRKFDSEDENDNVENKSKEMSPTLDKQLNDSQNNNLEKKEILDNENQDWLQDDNTKESTPASNDEELRSKSTERELSARKTESDEEQWSPDTTTTQNASAETSTEASDKTGTSIETSSKNAEKSELIDSDQDTENPEMTDGENEEKSSQMTDAKNVETIDSENESKLEKATIDDELKQTHQRNFAKALQDIGTQPRRRSVLIPDQRERIVIVNEERTRPVSESSTDGETTHDDGIIDFLGKENDRAEARLAARRQARVEAREIRMRELERVQKEQEETSDKVFDLHTPARQPSMSPRERPTPTNSYHSSRRSSEDSMEDGGISLRDLRHEVKEVEEKFRKAMIANAQLDNEKAALAYQVELLKDKLEDLEEAHSLLGREHRERCREHEALKRATLKLKEDLTVCKMQLDERDRLITDYGLIIVGGDINDKGEVTPRELVSNQAAQVLESAGEGSLDVRLKNLAREKNDLVDEVRHLKLELEEERTQRQNEQSLTNGPLSEDVVQTLNDYRFRLQKAEQETSTLQATVARLESQVIRYKSAAEESEKAEDELKTEKRKLLREHRESIARIEELETSNSHLQRRMDKLKNAKSTLLKEL